MSAAEAVVVGSGPNGLAAAVTLARAGLSVVVYEGADTAGGGCRTAELTLPGFHHDVCSSVHPLAAVSPFFAGLDLAGLGVVLDYPPVAFAHPLGGDRAAAVAGSVADTAATLGADGPAYRRLIGPVVDQLDPIVSAFLRPLRSVPGHPLAVARFGLRGLWPVQRLARRFQTEEARALVAGAAAHAELPLSRPLTGAFGLLFCAMGHGVGWPVVRGGSARLVEALVAELEAHGGRVETGHPVTSLDELDATTPTLVDVTPRQLVALAGGRLAGRPRRALARFAYGPGVCKVDWALSGPVPWTAPACAETATVHVGGTLAEVAASEAEVAAGIHPARPFCLVTQPGVVDPTRAPAGRQTLWAYCHVPAGSTVDMTGVIEAQIERFAPGFTDLVLARAVRPAAAMEEHNPNYVGGDIAGGAATLRQTLLRPTARWNPYRTALDGVYLCSASTPPGGGVHGMCGMGAAQALLADLGRR